MIAMDIPLKFMMYLAVSWLSLLVKISVSNGLTPERKKLCPKPNPCGA